MRWINHGERTVFQNPWLTVNMADVELPDGRQTPGPHCHPRKAGRPMRRPMRGEVLMLYRHRFIPDTWGWEVPGGGVNDGEIRGADTVAALLLLQHCTSGSELSTP